MKPRARKRCHVTPDLMSPHPWPLSQETLGSQQLLKEPIKQIMTDHFYVSRPHQKETAATKCIRNPFLLSFLVSKTSQSSPKAGAHDEAQRKNSLLYPECPVCDHKSRHGSSLPEPTVSQRILQYLIGLSVKDNRKHLETSLSLA